MYNTYMIPGVELTELLHSVGIAGITLIIFLESGIPFGFIFPGDSLLFTAGVLAAAGVLNLPLLIICVFLAAVLGVNVGYAFGKKYGKQLFSKEKSLLFNKEYIAKAEVFYESHGGKAIVMARFLPIVRTFAPIVAGVGRFNDKRVFFFNVGNGRESVEWLREVCHEAGHLFLPQIGPFEGDDRWANGAVGERLFMQWLMEEAGNVAGERWPSESAGEAVASTWGAA